MMKDILNKTGLSVLQIAMLGLILVFMLVAFWGGLENLVTRWLQREEYSHGFFIPAISIMFLWHRRDALVRSMGAPSFTGVPVILFAAILLLLGELSALYILIHIAFVLVLLGLVLVIGGWRLFQVAFLPIAFLVFAIPMPYFIDAQLTWGLQIISSELGTNILRLLGVSVFLEGNVIDLGSYQLQVVEACSGLNYLYPLLSLGFLAAYLFSAPLWQRGIVFLSTIPITIFMNSFRIAVIGVLVNHWGIEMAEGFLHFFEGWIIFLGCAVLLLTEIWLLDRLGKKRNLADILVVPKITAKDYSDSPAVPSGKKHFYVLVSAVLVVAVSIVTLYTDKREEKRMDRSALSGFPLVLGDWSAKESYLPSIVENQLKVDDYFLGDYRNDKNQWINFYIAFYESQRKGASPHSPRVCIPGGGWLITDLSEVIIEEPGYEPFPVNRIVIELEGHRQLGYYWFEQRGRRIANEYWMKGYLLMDAILMNRTDGALVRVMTSLDDDEEIEQAEERVSLFVKSALPIMGDFIPGAETAPGN